MGLQIALARFVDFKPRRVFFDFADVVQNRTRRRERQVYIRVVFCHRRGVFCHMQRVLQKTVLVAVVDFQRGGAFAELGGIFLQNFFDEREQVAVFYIFGNHRL